MIKNDTIQSVVSTEHKKIIHTNTPPVSGIMIVGLLSDLLFCNLRFLVYVLQLLHTTCVHFSIRSQPQ